MKTPQRYITLIASASLLLVGTTAAQSDRPAKATGEMGAISRVSKESVKSRLTAKDLIGAAVYDRAGEKIGDIADIDLQSSVPSELATSFNADQRPDRTTTSTDLPNAPTRTAMSAINAAMGHATILVSVGGLFGVGDDLVSVPASKLNYNAGQDRFELAMNKADVVALAEGTDRAGYAADTDADRIPATAAKQSFADEASRVQNALSSDPVTSPFAHKVTVTSDGKTLALRGTVDNREQKKRIIDAARRATSLDVDDKIEVQD
jgi:hypothetical protein